MKIKLFSLEIINLLWEFFKLHLIYEYRNLTLEKYMKIKKMFTEKDLLDIIDSVVSALIVFQKHNIHHGAI